MGGWKSFSKLMHLSQSWDKLKGNKVFCDWKIYSVDKEILLFLHVSVHLPLSVSFKNLAPPEPLTASSSEFWKEVLSWLKENNIVIDSFNEKWGLF